ncbi:hypothetical protein BS17DRAFT_783461 [Gyrodon lividus]|nr:hypothetical protein BS17DRAFT_783461 [Gyrodon lividus]
MLSEEYGGVSGDENETPELSYLVSPDTSQASEPEESPLIPTPEKRGDHFPFGVLHEKTVSLEEEPLEKVVGFERLRRKAPPPLHLEGSEDIDEDDSGCFLFNNVCGMNEGADGMMEKRVSPLLPHGTPVQQLNDCYDRQVLSPLTAGIPVHSKLSATLLRA